jgi:hypothetical protein
MPGSRALACIAAVPAAAVALPLGFGLWALIPASGGGDEVGAYVGLGLLAAALSLPILAIGVPVLSLGAEALLARLGWRGAVAYAATGAAVGAVAGPLLVGVVEGFDSSQRLLNCLLPGMLAGVFAASAYWQVRRPDRGAGAAMDAGRDGGVNPRA